jgi:hypothetical protein
MTPHIFQYVWNSLNATIYAEVEIPVASNLGPVSDKTLVASNLRLILVTSNVDVFYFTLLLK